MNQHPSNFRGMHKFNATDVWDVERALEHEHTVLDSAPRADHCQGNTPRVRTNLVVGIVGDSMAGSSRMIDR